MPLQPVVSAPVEEPGVPSGGEQGIPGAAGGREEEHTGEVAEDPAPQALPVQNGPHGLGPHDLDVVLVPSLQLFQQEVNFLLQN